MNSKEELNDLYKIYKLRNSSKDILIIFGIKFPAENINQDNSNNSFVSTNSNSVGDNPFYFGEEITEEKINIYDGCPSIENNIIDNNDKYFINEKNITSYEPGSLKETNKKFIENCRDALNSAFLNFSKIDCSKDYETFPFPGNFMTKSQYLKWFLNLDSNLENIYNKIYGDNLGTIETGLNNLKKIEEEKFKPEAYEEGNDDQSPYYNIYNKLFYFINIISKENIKLNKTELQEISTNISEILGIYSSDLFLIQNAPVDNYVKSLNFKEMDLNLNEMFQSNKKLYELKSIKFKSIIDECKINEKYLDNRGNCLYPN